ncbi:M23 family metallopeptidase [Alkalibacillus aidingensis]|uniref:M23 family metallopeptidase n=1 Tax=Alkalibacillus aidingensis TaxID=2747607 RepID=UPI001CB7474B|nr:M23 family metallopeptidase [Alkalibacillus aidingensis]
MKLHYIKHRPLSWLFMLVLVCSFLFCQSIDINAEEESDDNAEEELSEYDLRLDLYQKTETLTNIPWYYLAAIDQYERNVNDFPDTRLTGIQVPDEEWYGSLAFDSESTHLQKTIQLFGGSGLDGNGNGFADDQNDEDVLYTVGTKLFEQLSRGHTYDEILEEYYDREKAAKLINQYAKLFRHFESVDLNKRVFPIPRYHNYSFQSTWGAGRGYGGNRIHEGTDIFASYGTPVRSVSYGIVEIKGWNRYGGWRVGIRDTDNVYHYYAHLSGFENDIEEGSIVEPGDVIGYVGSSGYGPEGTSGKFPPHLHYGMYRDNGKHEWAFDPYPHLKRWDFE